MIEEDYVSFETAKLLKEKGFDVNTPCKYTDKKGAIEEWYDDYRERMIRFKWYEGNLIKPLTEPKEKYEVYGDTIPAPTLQMAMKWLREEHKCFIKIREYFDIKQYQSFVSKYGKTTYCEPDWFHPICNSYEQACEAAIKYCLENLI